MLKLAPQYIDKKYIYIKNATTKQSSEITINKFNNNHN